MARESPYRVAIANANVPNMLGQISTAMAQAGLNIHNMVNKSRGEMAYTLVDVDSPVGDAVLDSLPGHRRRAVGALPAARNPLGHAVPHSAFIGVNVNRMFPGKTLGRAARSGVTKRRR